MEKEWIPIVGTLGGVLVGGVIASFSKWIELRHQTAQERKKLIISRLEELHNKISEYESNLTNYYKDTLKHLNKYSDTQDVLKMADDLVHPLQKIGSTTKIYFPSGALDWSEIKLQVAKYNALCLSQIREEKTNTDAIEKKNYEIYELLSDFLLKIEKELKKHTGLN